MTRGSSTRGSRLVPRIALPLLLALCPLAHGQGATVDPALLANQPQADQKPHTVSGTVVDSVTGEPINRALVQIGSQLVALTDHEGHFEFQGVAQETPPFAMKPGYFADSRFSGFSQSSTAQSADHSLVVKLVPEAIISGTVTGSDGTPAEGIPVRLKMLAVANGLSSWNQRQETRTNSGGQYRFAELEAGKYTVATGFHIDGLPDAQSSVAYVPAVYPPEAASSASSSSQAAIILRPGDRREANLSPEIEKLYPVTGTVAGYGSSRGLGFRVETAAGEDISPFSRFHAPTGEFRMMLPGGAFTVTATTYEAQGPLEARREITVPRGPVNGVSFTLEPYANIPVEVEIEAANQAQSGQTAQGAEAARPEPQSVNINLTSVGPGGSDRSFTAMPRRRRGGDTSNPGALAFDGVAPGKYVMTATPPSPWYISSATCGGVDLMRDSLVIAGGAAGCSIRVVLQNDAGSVHVTLKDVGHDPSASIQGVFVSLLPLGDLVRQVVPLGGSGLEFTADGVAPGRYLVLAMDHRQEFAYRDPEALRRYAGQGQEITVTPNGKADAEVGIAAGEP